MHVHRRLCRSWRISCRDFAYHATSRANHVPARRRTQHGVANQSVTAYSRFVLAKVGGGQVGGGQVGGGQVGGQAGRQVGGQVGGRQPPGGRARQRRLAIDGRVEGELDDVVAPEEGQARVHEAEQECRLSVRHVPTSDAPAGSPSRVRVDALNIRLASCKAHCILLEHLKAPSRVERNASLSRQRSSAWTRVDALRKKCAAGAAAQLPGYYTPDGCGLSKQGDLHDMGMC